MLDIGEAFGHDGWFYNQTNLAASYDAVDAILAFVQASGNPWAFSIAPINEASDNFAEFASANSLTSNGTAWIVDYILGVISRTEAIDKRIPIMLQDNFYGEEHWSPYFDISTNMVIDTHIYYFAASGIYSEYVDGAICGQGSVASGDNKFPVFVGEWSLQVLYNNTFANRESIFNTQRYAWSINNLHGSTFWQAKMNGSASVDGEGVQSDYWSFLDLVDAGVIKSIDPSVAYC
jgi:hypothetical protein